MKKKEMERYKTEVAFTQHYVKLFGHPPRAVTIPTKSSVDYKRKLLRKMHDDYGYMITGIEDDEIILTVCDNYADYFKNNIDQLPYFYYLSNN